MPLPTAEEFARQLLEYTFRHAGALDASGAWFGSKVDKHGRDPVARLTAGNLDVAMSVIEHHRSVGMPLGNDAEALPHMLDEPADSAMSTSSAAVRAYNKA